MTDEQIKQSDEGTNGMAKTTISHSSLSFREGFYFYFQDGDDQIVARRSLWSGKVSIFINEQKITEKYSLAFNNQHEFSHKGATYRVIFSITGLINSRLECLLIKDNRVIGEETRAYKVETKRNPVAIIAGITFGCLGAGLGVGYLIGNIVQITAG